MSNRKICKEWPLPIEAGDLPEAAFLQAALWEPGQTVTIDFIDRNVPAWKKAWVQKVVKEMVQPHVNLDLKFGNYGRNADIRITFLNDGAYSRLGSQSAYKDPQHPESMNLGWLDQPHSGSFTWEGRTYQFPGCNDGCSRHTNGYVIIHEFGHALGMIHEHQNPKGGIEWNKEEVYRTFSGAPNYWSKQQIDQNVMDKLSLDLLNASEYDPKSVMLYAFDAELTLNGVGTQANPVMSPTDIEWMAKVYGKPKKAKQKDDDRMTPTTEEVKDEEILEEVKDEVKRKKRVPVLVWIMLAVVVLGTIGTVTGVVLHKRKKARRL